MKKHLLLLMIFVLSNVVAFAQEETTYYTNLEEAKTVAENENKHILVIFSGSDWCRSCIMLDRQLFQNEAFISFASDSLVLVKLDFPIHKKNKLSEEQTTYNESIAEKYNSKGAFPKVLVFKSDETLIGEMSPSLPSAEDYIQELKSFIQE